MITQPYISSLTSFCFRLRPGQDLKKELILYAQNNRLQAAAVLSCVGSLKKVSLRLSNRKETSVFEGPFEIVSLTGTMSADGLHMHISIANHDGHVIGGHLMDGCEIHTTAEVVLLENQDLIFAREQDEETGYKELVVRGPG